MVDVSLYHCRDYERQHVETAVRKAVDDVGGMAAYVYPGARVLLKPNMLSAHTPEHRITTDPSVVLAVGRLVLEAGGQVMIGDSPALDSFKRVARKSGLADVAEELGADIFPLSNPARVAVPGGGSFKSLEISSQALDADVVINLPKLKTHAQMLLTMGVKNLFGTIVAQRKAEWHLMIGMEREAFASLLIDVYRTVNPALTVIDGVWGMDGRGPANGKPFHIGLIGASPDALAMDMHLCRMLNVPWKKFPLYRAAVSRGLFDPVSPGCNLKGDAADLIVRGFETPQLEVLPLSGFWGGLTRRYLVSKPVQKPSKCVKCRKCVDICAAKAIELDDSKLKFNYEACIRCYCCQEVCPQDAIDFHAGPLARLLTRLGR